MSSRAQSFLTVAGVAALGVVAYAVYFDYKRRNDAQFRKNLRKEKKRVDKSIASSKAAAEAALPTVDTAVLRQALETVKAEPAPATPEEKEGYFMTQVSMGEQLAMQGPGFEVPAAMAFYKALRVYPSPVELMVIYQKTVPEHIFKMVIEMTNLDVSPSLEVNTSQTLAEELDDETSPVRGGPPSETSSQEWDKVSEPEPHPPLPS